MKLIEVNEFNKPTEYKGYKIRPTETGVDVYKDKEKIIEDLASVEAAKDYIDELG